MRKLARGRILNIPEFYKNFHSFDSLEISRELKEYVKK